MKCIFLLIGISLLSVGCAVHYYDAKSGTEHLFGVGHFKMKAIPQGNEPLASSNAVMAFVTSVSTFGLSIGAGQDYGGISVGWDSRERLIVKQDDASFCFIWPTNSIWMPWDAQGFFSLRVTTNLPPQLNH